MDKKTFLLREKIIDLIREYFKKEGFLEVETPLLVQAPDTSPYNEVFETEIITEVRGKRLEDRIIRAFLTPSPEFFMKKLLVGGYGNIFQICKAFRNQWEENSPLHNPEFTILEWYRTGADYTDIMCDTENLVNFIYDGLYQKYKKSKIKNKKYIAKIKKIINYCGKKIDLTPPWIRLSVKEAFRKYAGINLDKFLTLEEARKIAKNKGYNIKKTTTWEQIYHQIFLNEIEPEFKKLNKPLFLYDYPAQLAALSKRKKTDSRYCERFELYLGGLELANAFSELTNWQEQEKRLKNDILERKRLKMKVFDYDHDFISHLKIGLPETGGIALGVDRLVMLFTDKKTINDVLFFPVKKVFTKT